MPDRIAHDRILELAGKGRHGRLKEAEGVLFFSLGAIIAALEEDVPRVRRQIELTIRHRKDFGHYHHVQYDIACSLAIVGAHEEALEWLHQAAANGFPCYPLFERDPWLQSMRDTPPFTALMRALREECAGYAEIYGTAMGTPTG
jgi:hypothetical protein